MSNAALKLSTSTWAARRKKCARRAGSALLADTQLVTDILKSTVQAVSVPVSLKIRTGVDRNNRNV